MQLQAIEIISNLLTGVVANAVYDRVKSFAKDKPDEYENNDFDAFKEYLLTPINF